MSTPFAKPGSKVAALKQHVPKDPPPTKSTPIRPNTEPHDPNFDAGVENLYVEQQDAEMDHEESSVEPMPKEPTEAGKKIAV